ncbi:MAG: prepilin-type N-terminal cleavage/methylation domain-containing protein, partial [Planctomycetota bacterium]|nr:prepilin-type N-terminal cleavage/methylation domain-containing protein [Planctomycetota bacterium]
MTMTRINTTGLHASTRTLRRGFNLVELLIALGITATLLTSTLVALDASFVAYQRTTEEASTHTIARLAMHRMLTLIRTGQEFGPFPANPTITTVESNFIDFVNVNGQGMSLEWVENPTAGRPVGEALYVVLFDVNGVEQAAHLLLEGVVAQTDANGDPVPPFILDYELGRIVNRVRIDMMIVPDDNASLEIEGDRPQFIRLVASAMPRS